MTKKYQAKKYQSIKHAVCRKRSAVTLMELLVVIGIMVAVMAVAIPVIRLTTNDNRVSLATQAVRSFLQEAAAHADRHGRSYVFFERNANVPDFCYRMYRGRPVPAYRGEDETSYAIMAPEETVELPGVPNGMLVPPAPPGQLTFNVFYLFNADASKIRSFEYLSFRDRPERYLVYQAFQMPQGNSFRPVVKVFCRLDPQQPVSPENLQRTSYQPLNYSSEFQAVVAPHNGWAEAAQATPQRSSGGAANFWPADRVFYPTTGPADPADIPNFTVGTPGQFTSRLLAFEITQPPMLDELNYLDLPPGMAIYLGASGFGDVEGFTFGGTWFENFSPHAQLAFRGDLSSQSPPAVQAIIDNEVLDPSNSFVRNELSTVRREYFPRIEFQAGGRLVRAFAMSPRFTAVGSAVLPGNVRLVRQGPIDPVFPLFLLVGDDNVLQRSLMPAASPILPSDYWIMLGGQTSTPKIVKAQVGMTLEQSHAVVANSVSER